MGWEKLATVTYVDNQVDTADAISELTDVTIDTSATNELLFTTGANAWANKTLTEAGIHPLTTVGIGDGNLLAANDAVVDNDWLRINTTEVEGVSDSELIAALSLEIGVDIQAYDAQLADLAGLEVTDSSFIVGNGANFVLEDASTSRTSLGLAIGTDVQAQDDVLDDLSALVVIADNEMIVGTGAGTYANESGSDLRTSIGVGTGDTPTFTDLKLSGGDLTFTSAGTITGSDITAGVGLRISVHGGDAKAGNADLTAGALALAGGQGTGSGAGGDILFQVANAGIAGATTQNALATALTISDDKSATFAGAVSIAGNLDVNGTTTTIESTNTAIVDPAIVLNKTADSDSFGASDAAIIFGDSTGLTSTGKIINNNTTGFQFTDGGGASTNTPGDSTMNSSTAGTGYKDLYMKMPVLATVAATPTAVAGAIWFDGTDIYVAS